MTASCCQNVLRWQESLLALSALQIQTPLVRRLHQPTICSWFGDFLPHWHQSYRHSQHTWSHQGSSLGWKPLAIGLLKNVALPMCRNAQCTARKAPHWYTFRSPSQTAVHQAYHIHAPNNATVQLQTSFMDTLYTGIVLTLGWIKCRNDINVVCFLTTTHNSSVYYVIPLHTTSCLSVWYYAITII